MSNSNLSMFLKENATPVEDIEFVVSKRFVDADGNPIKWILRPISSKMDTVIREECMNVKKGTPTLDTIKYQSKLCVATVLYPNLNSAELQDSYGVMGAEALLQEMLTGGEFLTLNKKVMEITLPDEVTEEMIEDAKNF